jgi:NAD-dependent dihydropyrimidine dehydrogenase PreA subunit
VAYEITDKCNGCGACKKICPVEAISGERKNSHAIDRNACIECGACGRICPQSAVLDGLGKACIMKKRSQWDKPAFNPQVCMSCTICVETCPVSCLAMARLTDSPNLHEFPYLRNEKACLGCGFCSLDCPVAAVVMKVPDIVAAEKQAG